MSSASKRGKHTFAQHVEGQMDMLFPPQLKTARKARVIMSSEDPGGGSHQFVVTVSLQKLGKKRGNRDRLVILESSWMPIVRALQLQKGDTVSIFLLNDTAWTYLIAVERAPDEADRIDEADAMDKDVVPEEASIRVEFDLNEPLRVDMENNLNQPNQPVRMQFDLNEPVQPHSDNNLNDED